MSNKSINEKLKQLREEYRGASSERQNEIIKEANELKEKFIKCSECKKPFPEDDDREYGFCSNTCRDIYWVNAKVGRPTVEQMREKVEKMKLDKNLEKYQ